MRWPLASNKRLLHAMSLVLLQIVLNSIGFGVIAPALVHHSEFEFRGAPAEFAFVAAMATLGGALNVGLALCTVGRVSLRQLGWTSSTLAPDLAAGLLGFAACALVIAGMTFVRAGGDGVRALLAAMSSYSLAQRFLFVAIGLTAAFYEESVFRGYLQPAATARFGTGAGVVFVAAVFALYHLQLRPLALGGKFAIGLVLGQLRVVRPSLFAPAMAHALIWAVIGAA
jgi:membrane protease YdiL (CAAX protease family)